MWVVFIVPTINVPKTTYIGPSKVATYFFKDDILLFY